MKRALVSVALLLTTVGGLYYYNTYTSPIKDLEQLKTSVEEKERKTALLPRASSVEGIKIPSDSKSLNEIVRTPEDVLSGDDKLPRGKNDPFNPKFQTKLDIEGYVDLKTKSLVMDITADERDQIIGIRNQEIFKENLLYGSSVEKLLKNLKEKKEAAKKLPPPGSTASDINIIRVIK